MEKEFKTTRGDSITLDISQEACGQFGDKSGHGQILLQKKSPRGNYSPIGEVIGVGKNPCKEKCASAACLCPGKDTLLLWVKLFDDKGVSFLPYPNKQSIFLAGFSFAEPEKAN